VLCTKIPEWCIEEGAGRAAKDIHLFGSGVIRPAGDADTNDAVVGHYLGHVMGPEAPWLGGLQIHSGRTKLLSGYPRRDILLCLGVLITE